MKKNRLLLLLLFLIPGFAFAQLADIGTGIIRGSAADSKILAEGYLTPFMKSFGYGLNQGWYSSGAPHKFPGFDLTLTIAGVQVPTAGQTSLVDNTKMEQVKLTDEDINKAGPAIDPNTGRGNVPTFFGSRNQQPEFQSNSTPFNGLKGTGLKFLPVPMLGLGIGLPKGFDLKLRYVPTVDMSQISDKITGKLSMYGVGVQHDIKQWIPGVKQLPFDLSAFVGFTKMNLDVGFNKNRPDQKGSFSSSATTIQAIVSKKIAVLTGYIGLGYNIATTSLAVKGNYDLDGDGVTYESKDPFKIEATSTGPRATVGLRLKLAVIAFHGDYTLSKYKALTVGFGINVR